MVGVFLVCMESNLPVNLSDQPASLLNRLGITNYGYNNTNSGYHSSVNCCIFAA